MRLTPILLTGVGMLVLAIYFLALAIDDGSKLSVVYIFISGLLAVSLILMVSLEQVIVSTISRNRRATIWMIELMLISLICGLILWT